MHNIPFPQKKPKNIAGKIRGRKMKGKHYRPFKKIFFLSLFKIKLIITTLKTFNTLPRPSLQKYFLHKTTNIKKVKNLINKGHFITNTYIILCLTPYTVQHFCIF
jgi:hypothetical protein